MWLRDAVVPWQATSSSSASTGGKKNYSCRVVLPSRGLERGRGGWGPRLLSRPSLTRASATSVPRAHRRTFVAPFRSRYSRNRLFFLFLVFFPPFLSLSLASRSAHSANRDPKGKRVGASVRSSWRSQCIQRHGVVVIAPPLTSLPAPSPLLPRCRIDK